MYIKLLKFLLLITIYYEFLLTIYSHKNLFLKNLVSLHLIILKNALLKALVVEVEELKYLLQL